MRFLQKEIPGGAKVSCLATDFYPRNINLTLLRDGKPVAEQQLTGGSMLPNGNGLYQVRKSLELSSKELREKHNYTCVASRLIGDNKVELDWQPSRGRSHRLLVVSVTLLLGLLVALLLVAVGCWRMRRRRKKQHCGLSTTDNKLEVNW
ncbi:hereditary hemochromatosis protein homolog [Aplochiton taeniatus]